MKCIQISTDFLFQWWVNYHNLWSYMWGNFFDLPHRRYWFFMWSSKFCSRNSHERPDFRMGFDCL